MNHSIINMTAYTVTLDCGDSGLTHSIPSSGVITFMAVTQPAESGSSGGWEPETFVISGVPEELDDKALYIVTPGVGEALKAAGYDMRHFCTVGSDSLKISDEHAAVIRCRDRDLRPAA